jgi:serine/threonine-protein kinase
LDERAGNEKLGRAGRPPETAKKDAGTASPGTKVASAAPTTSTVPVTPEKPAAAEHETLFQQASAMEGQGNAKDAIRIYRRAARAGSGKAAKRLGEIFDRGVPGIPRDYAESLQWYETARQLGETVETAGKR